MKKLYLWSVYLLSVLLLISGCGNDEGDPTLVDCILSAIIITSNTTAENCGLSDGTIELSASGGESSLLFSIDGGANFQNSGTFENLTSGTFSVVVRDVNNCEQTSSVLLENAGGIAVAIDDVVNSTCGISVGEIIASSTGGTNVQFKLDNGSLQSSGIFDGLAAGKYTVHAVEAATGCETSTEATVLSGVSFSANIQNIITAKCAVSGCHVSGTGRADFTNFSTIQSNASGIKSRTQSGSMPKNDSITQEQKDLIACWVDDGALNN